MILDALLRFTGASTGVGNSDGATDSPTTGTQNSSNVIDLGISSGIPSSANGGGARDIGIGDKPAMKLLVQVVVAFASGTSLQLALQGAIDNGSGAASTFNNWWLSPAFAEAALDAGSRLYEMDMPRPPDGIAIPRFLRLGYITVGTHTAGSISGQIVLDRDDQFYSSTNNAVQGGYPAGINIAN
jgi:hypothetical protein